MKKHYPALLKKIWLFILVAIVAFGAVFATVMATSAPSYSASFDIYISKRTLDSSGNRIPTYYDFLSGELVANDCMSIIPGTLVLGVAAQNLGYTHDNLRDGLDVSSGGSARTLVISYTGESRSDAIAIVQEVVNVFFENTEEYFPDTEFEVIDGIRTNENAPTQQALVYGMGMALLCVCVIAALIMLRTNHKATKEAQQAAMDRHQRDATPR